MNLKDGVCIVTGSASGIGAACAIELAKRGCRTVINYNKSRDAADDVARKCRAQGGDALVVQANVAVDADCRRLVAETLEQWGQIDGLVNNAGTTKFAAHHDLEALDAKDFETIYATNVIGAFQMIRAVAPTMRRQGEGAIVNMASIAAVMGNGSSVAYAASKGALNTMTLSLARALGPQIRVNAVCPGFVETNWLQDGLGRERYEQARAEYEKRVPLQQAIKPEDVADTVIWLLSGARLVTGESIIVDSGSHLGGAPLKAR
jgi:3-oxoacyl-[acyl-carrier protein] reductase